MLTAKEKERERGEKKRKTTYVERSRSSNESPSSADVISMANGKLRAIDNVLYCIINGDALSGQLPMTGM